MPMNPEIKKKWAENLLDPSRVQGTGMLRDLDGKQCCLDVLNQMCSDAGVQPQPFPSEEAGCWIYPEEDKPMDPKGLHPLDRVPGATTFLTDKTVEWCGLDDYNPMITYNHPVLGRNKYSAARLNDDLSLSFPEIAKAIEEDETL